MDKLPPSNADYVLELERRLKLARIALRDIRWQSKHEDEYAAATCGKLANDALAKIGDEP